MDQATIDLTWGWFGMFQIALAIVFLFTAHILLPDQTTRGKHQRTALIVFCGILILTGFACIGKGHLGSYNNDVVPTTSGATSFFFVTIV